MRGHVFYRGHLYVLAQDPPEPTEEEEPEAPAEEKPDPDATVDDELEGKASPEDAERGDNLGALGLGEDLPGGDEAAPEDAGPEPEDPEKLSRDIEKSPASNWRGYLQPILKDIKQQFGGVAVSLLNPQIENDIDVDLGFYVTGYVRFLEETPDSILDEYGDAPLHFKVFVDPDGKLQRSSLQFYTELD